MLQAWAAAAVDALRPTCGGAAAHDLAQRLDVLRIHLLLLAAGVDVPEAGPVAQVRADVLRAVEALHFDRLDLLRGQRRQVMITLTGKTSMPLPWSGTRKVFALGRPWHEAEHFVADAHARRLCTEHAAQSERDSTWRGGSSHALVSCSGQSVWLPSWCMQTSMHSTMQAALRHAGRHCKLDRSPSLATQ